NNLMADNAAVEECLPHQRIAGSVLEQAAARYRCAFDTGSVERFAPAIGAFGVRDIDRFSVKCETARAQAGDRCVSAAARDLHEQVLAFLSSHLCCPFSVNSVPSSERGRSHSIEWLLLLT